MIKINRITITILLWVILVIPNSLFAACTGSSPTWSTTPDYASVNTCVKNASAGDTIDISTGSEKWSDTVTVGKALTIKGNGTKLTAGAKLLHGFFYITGFTDNTNLMRITNFTFDSVSIVDGRRAIQVQDVTLSKLRIDHNIFKFGYTQVEVGGAYGVIDNNEFYNGYDWLLMSAGTREQADASWADLSAGTANAMFVENNKFIIDADWPYGSTKPNGDGVDAYNGGKIVFRYNEFDGDNIPWDPHTVGTMYTVGFHGSAAAGCADGYWQIGHDCRRSPSVVEIYNNTYHGKRIDWMMTLRGGSGLIYNNVHTSGYTVARISLKEEEYYLSSAFSPTRIEWPAEDQVHNTFIWGNTTQGSPMTSTNISIDDFNSHCTGSTTPFSCCTGTGTGTCRDLNTNPFIRKDRDFFLHAPCGASDAVDAYGNACTHGKASFTGANGASASYPTNGSIYPTQGTMIFTKSGDNAYYGYIPYTYPHPLRRLGNQLFGGVVVGGTF